MTSSHETLLDTMPTRRRSDGHRTSTKRSLLAVSRSIEGLAERTTRIGAPLTVLALFEDATYFAFEAERYARLAEHATVLVGFTGTMTPAVPDGIHVLSLPADHELADDWTVLAISPAGCAGLVARDLDQVIAAPSLERGRVFDPRMSTTPAWIASEVQRIVHLAGDLLDVGLAAELLGDADIAADRGAAIPERLLREQLLSEWQRYLEDTASLQHAEHLANTDHLTGAYNRRFLDHFLGRIGPRAPRIAAIAFDLDDFKSVNDTFGHAAGDDALRRFADTVRAEVRASDLLIRLGGDEWLVLLPGLAVGAAQERAHAIVERFAATRLAHPAQDAVLRTSAGIGELRPDHLDLGAIDAAMYAAKRAGGGRVSFAADLAATPDPTLGAVTGQAVAPSSAVTNGRPKSSSEIPV